jgi:hypothetical protein
VKKDVDLDPHSPDDVEAALAVAGLVERFRKDGDTPERAAALILALVAGATSGAAWAHTSWTVFDTIVKRAWERSQMMQKAKDSGDDHPWSPYRDKKSS